MTQITTSADIPVSETSERLLVSDSTRLTAKPKLVAQWLRDQNSKLYCKWVTANSA